MKEMDDISEKSDVSAFGYILLAGM